MIGVGEGCDESVLRLLLEGKADANAADEVPRGEGWGLRLRVRLRLRLRLRLRVRVRVRVSVTKSDPYP